MENRRKNLNIEKDGATKTINFSGFHSVVHKALDELMLEESLDPLTRGNIVRRDWSQLQSAAGGTQPKKRKIAKQVNPSSNKAKVLKPNSSVRACSHRHWSH